MGGQNLSRDGWQQEKGGLHWGKIGKNWQELAMGKFNRGNQWTWLWKYFCDSAAGSLNDMLNDGCGS